MDIKACFLHLLHFLHLYLMIILIFLANFSVTLNKKERNPVFQIFSWNKFYNTDHKFCFSKNTLTKGIPEAIFQ